MRYYLLNIIWIAAAVLVFAFVVRTAVFMPEFIRLNKYLKSEIQRAENSAERRHWKRTRRKLFFCFIPFVDVNNVEGFHGRKR